MAEQGKRDYSGHAYLGEDGNVDGEKLLERLKSSPGGVDALIAGILADRGHITDECVYLLGRIVKGACDLALLASVGAETAMNQLKAAERIIYPAKCELPISVIENIANRITSPPLARAMELRAIMGSLSRVTAPAKGEQCDVNEPVKLIDTQEKHWAGIYELARKHWLPGTTLQAMAIKIYLERLRDEGVLHNEEIDESSLKKDLRMAREWEASHLDADHWNYFSLNKEPIRVFEVYQDWKDKRRAKKERIEGEGEKSDNSP